MNSVILHLILAFLLAVGASALYIKWRSDEASRKFTKNLLYFYFFFNVYHLSLALPYIIFNGNLEKMAWGYIIAIASVFFITISFWRLLVEIFRMDINKVKYLMGFFCLWGAAAVGLLIYDFRLPMVLPSGFIMWNGNILAGSMAGFFCVLSSFVWLGLVVKNWPQGLGWLEKSKITMLIAGPFFFSIAGFIYFVARGMFEIIFAFVIVFLGTIIFSIPFFIPSHKLFRSDSYPENVPMSQTETIKNTKNYEKNSNKEY